MAPADEYTPSPGGSSRASLLSGAAARGRRGSLASLKSNRGEVDKEVRAQALDDIHTTASKSDALTSFHDYDGGPVKANGAKEMVSNGVTGFYDKLKRGFTSNAAAAAGPPNPTPTAVASSRDVSESRSSRPKTSASKQSTEVDSVQSPTALKQDVETAVAVVKGDDAASLASVASTANGSIVVKSPLPSTSTDRNGKSSNGGRRDPETVSVERPDRPTADDVELARDAWRGGDLGTAASEALARVLSHHGPPPVQVPQRRDEVSTSKTSSQAVLSPRALAAPAMSSNNGAASMGVESQPNDPPRPPLLRIGPSHLPGYQPSRTSSTDGGDSSSQATATGQRALRPSPNINTALQRKRTDMRPPPRPAALPEYVPSSIRRRVISKDFWMKDENAKDCFCCGQPFSTFRRKHHCRTCGQIFDARCTNLVPGRPFGQPGTIRLCKPCEAIIQGSDDDDSTIFSDDGASILERSPMIGRRSFGTYDNDLRGTMDGLDDRHDAAAEPMTPSIGIPASRRNREAKRRSAVIEIDAGPIMPRPASSHSLMSLSRRPRSSSHRRFHSRHQPLREAKAADERVPFQAGSLDSNDKNTSLPAFHNDNIIDPDLAAFLSDEGSDDEDQTNSIFATLGASGDSTHASPGLLASAVRKNRSRHNTAAGSSGWASNHDDRLQQATKHLPKLSRHRHPSMNSISFSRPSPRRTKSQTLNVILPDSHERQQNSPLAGQMSATSGTRLLRSSALRGRDAPSVELNAASLRHLKRLLSQLLRGFEIPNLRAWEKALLPILLKCADDVDPNVQYDDDMDIRHYIKLKKVPSGRPSDTAYISGVVFSKNVALRTMPRSLANPRIAIVTFAIEYARYNNHVMSLEPVIAQEQEYLRNLVGRIVALKPQVLLVQRNVSGAALNLLHQAGVTVAYHIKESVLAAVARMTQTTMIKSVDQLAMDPRRLGMCASFDIKTYVHDGAKKTYVYLSGCQPDLGCTIVLRGADTKVLRRIKRVTEFMCYVAYNLKLEASLLGDELVEVPVSGDEHAGRGCQAALSRESSIRIGMGIDHGESLLSGNHHASTGEEPSKYEQMERDWKTRILSASPFVVFMQPYMLTQLRDSERRLATYEQLRDQYAAANIARNDNDEQATEEHFEMVKPEMVHVPPSRDQPKAIRDYLYAVHQVQYDKTMHTYETQRRLMDAFTSGPVDPFDPFSHQSIVVLHSIVSTKDSAPCHGPLVIGVGFYAGYNHVEEGFDEDCTLGQYVEDMCQAAGAKCQECDKKMFDHHRQYVHGYGQVSISLARPPLKTKRFEDGAIMMWSTCRLCKTDTPVVPMSESTWKYSFAKYLELSFWSSPLHPRPDICEHDIHKDFVRHLGCGDLVVRIQYDAVDIYDVIVPRSTITWKVESDLIVKNEQFSHFVKRLQLFTDSIKKRLDSISIDTLDDKKSAEANNYLAELRERAEQDHHELMCKLQQKYSDSRYYELIPLNRALRFMDEKALEWDDLFNKIENDYFPSETDIRKLAAIQLKDMFLASQPTSSNAGSDVSDDEDSGTESKPSMGRSKTAPLVGGKIMREKAHNVLSSAVEEHRGNIEGLVDVEKSIREDSPEKLGAELSRNVSPREEQEHVVEREGVRHLDLAVPGESLDQASASPPSDESKQQASQPTSPESRIAGDEPFAIQSKPLGSGLLERIEQIRSNRGPPSAEQETTESKIPRLADLQRKRDTSPQPALVPPPLLRAQSSPSSPQHSPHRSVDLASDHSIDAVANGLLPADGAHLEKHRAEKLGIGRLASKVGKVAPSLIPRSIPTKEDSQSTKVSALAKHFEQMSREFERERLRERRQRVLHSRQARANPLASSQPVVEVYRNATDAVGERSVDAARAPQADEAALAVQTNSDDVQVGQDIRLDDQSIYDQQTAEDVGTATDGENQSSDNDPQRQRSRDVSDLSSTLAPGTMSPTAVPDIELPTDLPITEQKKSQWLSYLKEFWSNRSSSGWSALEYPLHATEHVFEDSDIIVREDEPSSVIALALACADYQEKSEDFRSHPNKSSKRQQGPSVVTSDLGSSISDDDKPQDPIAASLLTQTSTHMRYAFAHGQVKTSCKIFYAESFDALRRRCCVADRFVESLSRCYKYDSKGGKTKSLFLRTLDERFVIKSLQEVELKAFLKFAPDYFQFMGQTLFDGLPSVIAKMFGVFQVTIKNPSTGLDFSSYLLVMENLFYERKTTRRFDLKGSMRNRKVESTGQPDEVLLDENLVETIFEKPLFVREHARKLLVSSIRNDTIWLCQQNVMDYSLMAGFDDERKELVVGIIDCIRTYTWDKKLESWIKDRGKNKPTITSPRDYRNRFRESMRAYFLQAPNCWYQFQAQMAPPKTLKEREEKEDGMAAVAVDE